MPIQPTTLFLEVHGVSFPIVDPAIPSVDDITFGVDTGGSFWIYKLISAGPPEVYGWVTPITQELVDNIPQYVDSASKTFTITSSTSLTPIIMSFRWVGKKVLKVEDGYGVVWYGGLQVSKPLNGDTLSIDNGDTVQSNFEYKITIE